MDRFTVAKVSDSVKRSILKKTTDYEALRTEAIDADLYGAKISGDSMDSMLDNLAAHKDTVAYYAHLNELEKTEYSYFKPSYNIVSIDIDGNLAIVDVYEVIDFQYVELDQSSMMMTHFCVSLVKNGGEWLIMSVESDDMIASDPRFDLEKELRSIDAAYIENERRPDKEMPAKATGTVETAATNGSASRKYNAQNAINYALTYTSTLDGNKTGKSYYYNQNFRFHNADCQRFVSQCLWAGFGGSNDLASIRNKIGMDTEGQYRWWGTTSTDSNPDEIFSWRQCESFKKYVDAVKTSTTESGIVCVTNEVKCNADSLTAGTNLSKTDLLGAALHVKNGSNEQYGHAIIITYATGTSRDKVYFSSYNKCARNIKLSTKFNSSKNTYDSIYVMVPKELRGGNGNTSKYLYGDLSDHVAFGSYHTVYGRASVAFPTLILKVYKPNAATPTYTFNAKNAKVISGSVLFNKVGLWRMEVSSSDSSIAKFTYTIRVIQKEGEPNAK